VLGCTARCCSCSAAVLRGSYKYLDSVGLAPVGGGCVTVGVAGFHLGAGFSFLSRSYGLGIDNLLRMNVMLANGTALTLSATSGPQDLWWAMRGAGGGNFAVLTSLTVQVGCRSKTETP
jgi:FAD/FMN-containing dehydrogenase